MITLGILSTTPGVTNAFEVVGARVTDGGTYNSNLPSVAYSYDGVARDISRFYQDEQTNFYIKGHVTFDTGTRVFLGYNSGIDTAKFDVSKSYNIGIAQIIQSNWIVSANATIGGKQRHTICIDKYNRNYYCGDLTAWSDFKEPKHEIPYSASIKYVHRF